jgi:hypothetical protein
LDISFVSNVSKRFDSVFSSFSVLLSSDPFLVCSLSFESLDILSQLFVFQSDLFSVFSDSGDFFSTGFASGFD